MPLRRETFQHVRLALTGQPFVLAGQLDGAHLMKHPHEIGHELSLGPIFLRPQQLGRNLFSAPPPSQQVEPIVGFQPPGPPVNPLPDLATATQVLVDQGSQDIGHTVRPAEALPRRSADELLP